MSVEHLEWDSEFFGVQIGQSTSDVSIDAIGSAATALGITCVYVETSAPLETEVHDLRLVDRRILLSASVDGDTTQPAGVRPALPADLGSLGPALDRLAPWSRFARDPGFGVVAARRMYDAWLHRSMTTPNERFGVTDKAEGATGFVTIRLDSDAEIGLIGAAADGTGTGQRLIDWAFNAASESRAVSVVTQAENARALALYERNGFVRQAESFMYHLWLTNPDG